uniref:P-selectin glycoprotein ligand 1 n=1 Tax=Monopterus albus TaxID=43700 RepID=A0A3Q3IQ78_MONAL|nr:P-selectin glycoprotein ligand 1 [Monopterus albus]XP_020441381.1 P-selectin glycoprotein ligand 1 [Monopterus albus]
MMLCNMKTCLTLLWGVPLLFSVETKNASIPETHSSNTITEPNRTTHELTSSHLLHSETATQPASWDPTHKPAEVSVAATAETPVSPTVETQETTVRSKSNSSNSSTAGLGAVNTVAATVSSAGPRLLHAITTASETQPSHNTEVSETARPTGDQQSPTTSTNITAPAAIFAASSATVSSPKPTSITEPEVTSALSSTSSNNLTQVPHFIQNLNTTTVTTNPTSEAAPTTDPTSLPVIITETSTTSTELSSIFHPISGTRSHISTSQFPNTKGSNSDTESSAISVSTDSSSSATSISASPPGILNPRGPKTSPVPTAKSTTGTTTTAAPCEVSRSPTSTEGQLCSTRGVVKHCLIVIASLAGLATIFMVSTIVLCAKLSSRKYKLKKPQQATEMMCISALLPERNYSYARQRNPVTNGVRVILTGEDSDEEGGDNLTLSSFLPESDRIV